MISGRVFHGLEGLEAEAHGDISGLSDSVLRYEQVDIVLWAFFRLRAEVRTVRQAFEREILNSRCSEAAVERLIQLSEKVQPFQIVPGILVCAIAHPLWHRLVRVGSQYQGKLRTIAKIECFAPVAVVQVSKSVRVWFCYVKRCQHRRRAAG